MTKAKTPPVEVLLDGPAVARAQQECRQASPRRVRVCGASEDGGVGRHDALGAAGPDDRGPLRHLLDRLAGPLGDQPLEGQGCEGTGEVVDPAVALGLAEDGDYLLGRELALVQESGGLGDIVWRAHADLEG